jgi:uncharacterized protein YecT (DUF1311 family)
MTEHRRAPEGQAIRGDFLPPFWSLKKGVARRGELPAWACAGRSKAGEITRPTRLGSTAKLALAHEYLRPRKWDICMIGKILLLSSALLLATCASPNDRAIKTIAEREQTSVEEIREVIATGCDSGMTRSMTQCAAYLFKLADFELDGVFEQLKAQLTTSKARSRLAVSQRAWLVFRDAACDYESDGWEGGTGRNMIILSCKEEHTKIRIGQIRKYLSCQQPTCPGEW